MKIKKSKLSQRQQYFTVLLDAGSLGINSNIYCLNVDGYIKIGVMN